MFDEKRVSVLAVAAALPAATLYEAAGQCGDMAPAIRPIGRARALAGFACTVRVFPGDNLGVFHAIESARPDDVLVIDAGGTDRVTVWGGTSSVAARARGVLGCVTNGAVRDIAEISELGFAVYAAGASVRGAAKRHPGWHGEPVSVGDVVVHPGDLVVGDEDGVVVIAHNRIDDVLAAARVLQRQHAERDQRLREGARLMEMLGLNREP